MTRITVDDIITIWFLIKCHLVMFRNFSDSSLLIINLFFVMFFKTRRYCKRAKFVFKEMKKVPFVVELDERGTLSGPQNFFYR